MKTVKTGLYRIYQLMVLLPVTILATSVIGILATVGCPLGNDKWSAWFGNICGRVWGRIIVRVTLLPVSFSGRENLKENESYVFVANHQSCYDIFLLFGFINRPIRWMMKSELERVPFVGSACKSAGEIFVDNSSKAKIKASYIQARQVLRNGVSLMVFPEGCRTFTGKMSPFKKGAFAIADELQLPVVPITLNGPFHVMPRMRDFHFANWCPLSVTIHKPIYPIGNGRDNVEHTMNESYVAINSSLEEAFRD